MKILFLGANGIDTSRLRIGAEFRDIHAELDRARAARAIEIRMELAVTPLDLNRILLEYEPDVVHFSGHGSIVRAETSAQSSVTREFEPIDVNSAIESKHESAILLETNEGRTVPVSTEALAGLFGILKTQRCVVLNACFSANQAPLLTQHVDCVIGMKRAIDDRSAIVFAIGFYQAIARGQTIQRAFDLGRSLITTCGLPDSDIPELHSRVDPTTLRLLDPRGPIPTANGLQVSDVQLVPNREDGTCTLDFRLWNDSNGKVFVNRVSLLVVGIIEESMIEISLCHSQSSGHMAFSHVYDIDLSSLKAVGDQISCNVSQVIQAQDVDRFGIRVTAAEPRRRWKLQTSLFTNRGHVEGPLVDVSLPVEIDEVIVRRRAQETARIQLAKAAPSCLKAFRVDLEHGDASLASIRLELEEAYPSDAKRSLILFEWLGAGGESWQSAAVDELSMPERLLMEFENGILVEALTTNPLTREHMVGATRFFAKWRQSPIKWQEPDYMTDALKTLFVEHCQSASYSLGQLTSLAMAIGDKSLKFRFYSMAMRQDELQGGLAEGHGLLPPSNVRPLEVLPLNNESSSTRFVSWPGTAQKIALIDAASRHRKRHRLILGAVVCFAVVMLCALMLHHWLR